MMSLKTVIIASALGLVSFNASSEIFTFESTGVIEQFGVGFGGADQFPFIGLAAGDQIFFHFEYDINTLPTSNDGLKASYNFDGAGSFVRLGSTTLEFDEISISLGSGAGGHMSFNGSIASLGFSAGLTIEGPTPLQIDLPTSIDLSQFTWSRNSGANSDQNQFLLPIVMGTVDTAVITPAPATIPLIMGGLLVGTRRRRAQ